MATKLPLFNVPACHAITIMDSIERYYPYDSFSFIANNRYEANMKKRFAIELTRQNRPLLSLVIYFFSASSKILCYVFIATQLLLLLTSTRGLNGSLIFAYLTCFLIYYLYECSCCLFPSKNSYLLFERNSGMVIDTGLHFHCAFDNLDAFCTQDKSPLTNLNYELLLIDKDQHVVWRVGPYRTAMQVHALWMLLLQYMTPSQPLPDHPLLQDHWQHKTLDEAKQYCIDAVDNYQRHLGIS